MISLALHFPVIPIITSITCLHNLYWERRDGCSGEITHLPPKWLGLEPRTQCLVLAAFLVGCYPGSKGFPSWFSRFSPSRKTSISNLNSVWKQWMKSHSVNMPLQITILSPSWFEQDCFCCPKGSIHCR